MGVVGSAAVRMRAIFTMMIRYDVLALCVMFKKNSRIIATISTLSQRVRLACNQCPFYNKFAFIKEK